MVVTLQRSGIVIVALMMLTTQSACNGSSDSDSSDAVQAVKATFKAVDASTLAFHEGPLQGGTAVLADNAAYWVRDGRAYAANGIAKMWSPSLEYAPVGVDMASVEQAVKKARDSSN